ncbi:MAG: arginine N-succinyltransferase [Rickettsiales bacterium]|nr:arginine N-succinyltransferase [Rickettsiales bacterium]
MYIRPICSDDHAAVLELAEAAGIGMTSLPANADVLSKKIERAEKSFAKDPDISGHEVFLFVMVDDNTNQVVGTTGIKAHIGLNQPFYSYKLTTITQHSSELDIFSKHALLQVTNDLTDSSEISSLFLKADYRRDQLGRLLSLCRFLFMAAYKDYFSDTVIAELRGFHDPTGLSPFYNSIAKHFFEMEFPEADYMNATKGNQFISDLMPRNPIYVSLLPKEAQHIIGQPHPNSMPAKAMLEKQGFRWNGYVDIFDGGPTLQADINFLKPVQRSKCLNVSDITADVDQHTKYLISNDRFADFRCTADFISISGDNISITPSTAEQLKVGSGDTVRILPQKSEDT